MILVEHDQGVQIAGVRIPEDLYWVLSKPTALAGMRYPSQTFPWAALHAAGFAEVVSLHPGSYNPTPLKLSFSQQLQDLAEGGLPTDAAREEGLIQQAVQAVITALQSNRGVVVHCFGGRGRTGTVLGCALRRLGFSAADVVSYLNRVHKARGRRGWPESPWQSTLVHNWNPAAQ